MWKSQWAPRCAPRNRLERQIIPCHSPRVCSPSRSMCPHRRKDHNGRAAILDCDTVVLSPPHARRQACVNRINGRRMYVPSNVQRGRLYVQFGHGLGDFAICTAQATISQNDTQSSHRRLSVSVSDRRKWAEVAVPSALLVDLDSCRVVLNNSGPSAGSIGSSSNSTKKSSEPGLACAALSSRTSGRYPATCMACAISFHAGDPVRGDTQLRSCELG